VSHPLMRSAGVCPAAGEQNRAAAKLERRNGIRRIGGC
jgi:hypothetical protein